MNNSALMAKHTLVEIERQLGKPLSDEGKLIVKIIVEGLAPYGAPGLWALNPDRVLRLHEKDPKEAKRLDTQVRENTDRTWQGDKV